MEKSKDLIQRSEESVKNNEKCLPQPLPVLFMLYSFIFDVFFTGPASAFGSQLLPVMASWDFGELYVSVSGVGENPS